MDQNENTSEYVTLVTFPRNNTSSVVNGTLENYIRSLQRRSLNDKLDMTVKFEAPDKASIFLADTEIYAQEHILVQLTA